MFPPVSRLSLAASTFFLGLTATVIVAFALGLIWIFAVGAIASAIASFAMRSREGSESTIND